MRLFDYFVMVDWSAANGRRAGKEDCIWIAHGDVEAKRPDTVSPRSRSEAQKFVCSVVKSFIDRNDER